MVREKHKMVREMSEKSQGILWGLMAGHTDLTTNGIPVAVMPVLRWQKWVSDAYIIYLHWEPLKYGTQKGSPVHSL